MPDEASYSQAAKALAETTGKAIDMVAPGFTPVAKEGGGIIANALGYFIGDKLEHARTRNLAALEDDTRAILAARQVSDWRPVSISLAVPLLEAAQDESRAELRSLWARLLANAMDPARHDDLRHEFIDALKRFHPHDALILLSLRDLSHATPTKRVHLANILRINETSVIISFQNLARLGCVSDDVTNPHILAFGSGLLSACAA